MDLPQLIAGLEAVQRHGSGGSASGILELRIVTENLVIEMDARCRMHVQSGTGGKATDICPGGVAKEFAVGSTAWVQTTIDGFAIEVRPDSTRREIDMALELSKRDNVRGVDLLAAAKQRAANVG